MIRAQEETYDDVHILAILHYTLIASPRASCLRADSKTGGGFWCRVGDAEWERCM